MKRRVRATLAAILLPAYGAAAHAQQQNFDAFEIHTLQVRDGIYMIVGAGGNITM